MQTGTKARSHLPVMTTPSQQEQCRLQMQAARVRARLTWEPPWEAPCTTWRTAWRQGSSTNSVEMARNASCMAGGR